MTIDSLCRAGMVLALALATVKPACGADSAVATVRGDTLRFGLAEASAMMAKQHLLLMAKDADVAAAKATLQQDKLYDNPNVSVSHNVNNPVTHRYFDVGRDGETDVQLSQRIFIGGQRSERIRRSKADLQKAEYDRSDAERLARRELFGEMAALACAQQKVDVIERQVQSVDRILAAYAEQEQKGNVAKVEVTRIRNMRLQLLQDRKELMDDMADMQQNLRVMTGVAPGVGIVPEVDYARCVAALKGVTLRALTDALASRADAMADKCDVEAGMHEVKLQRANALPEVSLTGEWDKNGNIGHNYFALGVSLSIPIFNRNQGGVRAAKASLDAKRLVQSWNMSRANAETVAGWERLQNALAVAMEAEAGVQTDGERMMADVETQYVRHNISLLEFLDHYESYRAARCLLLDSRRDVVKAMAELDIDMCR